jgi:Undecaprenyl-phosphate galactose phosphotransferase WbaP
MHLSNSISPIHRGYAFPGWQHCSTVCLVAADLLALLFSVALSVGCKMLTDPTLDLDRYLRLRPFLFVFLFVYWMVGLYSPVAFGPAEELRRATISSTLVFLSLAAATVSIRGAHMPFTWVLFLAVGASVLFVPVMRGTVRRLFAERDWWGRPAIVFGADQGGRRVVRALLRDPGLGLKPIAWLSEEIYADGDVEGVPIFGDLDMAPFILRSPAEGYAVIAMSGISHSRLCSLVDRLGAIFPRVLLIPDSFTFSSGLVSPRSFGSFFGLAVDQQVLIAEGQWVKRFLDFTVALAIGIVLLPAFLLLALAIRLDSRGPVFYGHRRIGKGGFKFKAWKFRSMAVNAEQLLEAVLRKSPELRVEWELNHKLRDDPRITRVGRFLRKTSLDELPQLWNVIVGEMSLVGPRPIVEAEVPKYGDQFELYTRVRGGVTGLWQVSGRNSTTYEERVSLDIFYVRNWSVWLDLCILFRTIEAILLRKGAY